MAPCGDRRNSALLVMLRLGRSACGVAYRATLYELHYLSFIGQVLASLHPKRGGRPLGPGFEGLGCTVVYVRSPDVRYACRDTYLGMLSIPPAISALCSLLAARYEKSVTVNACEPHAVPDSIVRLGDPTPDTHDAIRRRTPRRGVLRWRVATGRPPTLGSPRFCLLIASGPVCQSMISLMHGLFIYRG
ncbi:hypothetical protein F5X98DRAFT_228440 [Xylaria grammica]|nr:hypothetical protein F5X98DRAFT_228440 [Xylaria grammica]